MDDLQATRELLSRQLDEAIETEPLEAIATITTLHRDLDGRLREAVRRATPDASWREVATALGVSKQAAYQRFKAYAEDATEDIRAEHRAMKQARRKGDHAEAARAKARRDDLAGELRSAAKALKDEV